VLRPTRHNRAATVGTRNGFVAIPGHIAASNLIYGRAAIAVTPSALWRNIKTRCIFAEKLANRGWLAN
jgi:hypothetical protein